MKEFLANLALGIPAVIIALAVIVGIHKALGENMAPVLMMTALFLAAGAVAGIGIREVFSKTTLVYRLNRWIRK